MTIRISLATSNQKEVSMDPLSKPNSESSNTGQVSAASNRPTQNTSGPTPQYAMPPVITPVNPKKPGKKKFMFIAVLAGIFLVGGSAAGYMQFVQNNPEKIWERALNSTSRSLDALIEERSKVTATGSKIDGSFSITSPIAADGTMKGQSKGSDGTFSMSFGVAGVRVDGEMITKSVEGSETPDLYFKLKGLDSISAILSSFGVDETSTGGLFSPDALAAVNDTWYVVDHTLINQAVASTGSSSDMSLSEADIKEIATAISRVLKDTVFTANDKAVLNVVEELGQEKFEDTEAYKYKVGINKENLKNMLTQLKEALKETKLKQLIASESTMSYDELFDIDELFKQIDSADMANTTADVWVEKNGAFVRNIRFYPEQDKKDTNYLDIGIPYKGGDLIPIVVKATIADESMNGTLAFGMDLKKTSTQTRFWMSVKGDTPDGTAISADGDMSLEPSNDDISVEKPADARNVYELLGVFGGLMGAPTGADQLFDPTSIDPSLLDSLPVDDSEIQ